MKYDSFSVVAGTLACNAHCPFCIAGMTPKQGLPDTRASAIDKRNFRIACRMAAINNLDTVKITGKGEPTIFPDQITEYLSLLQEHDFPLLEIQTNGILLAQHRVAYESHLRKWYELGLTHFCISVVHYEPEKNRQVYLPNAKSYIDLPELMSFLHELGFNIRLTCIMQKGFVDSGSELENLITFARDNNVEQITALPVNKPSKSRDPQLYDWIAAHQLADEDIRDIRRLAMAKGTKIATLPWGAEIFDIGGQNVCLTRCLTIAPETNEFRQLIFIPPGTITADWQYSGSLVLRNSKQKQPPTNLVTLT
jgi:molybdenum cofactor biosynthesis enzyme MoaA